MDGTFGKPLAPQLALCTGLQFSRERETDVRHSARHGPSCTLTMQLDGPSAPSYTIPMTDTPAPPAYPVTGAPRRPSGLAASRNRLFRHAQLGDTRR